MKPSGSVVRRRAAFWLLLIVGLAVAVIGGQQVWAAAHPVSASVQQAGDVPLAGASPNAGTIPAIEPAGQSSSGPSHGVGGPAASIQPVHLIPGPPTSIQLDAVGLHTPVVTVGVQADGAVQVPADVATVGWVAGSARPGARSGTTTMVGHVDDATGAYGALHRLYAARIGQIVVVHASTGEALAYRIQAIQLTPRASLPADLFQTTGRPRLALVTCAGTYSRNHGFADNLIIWAVPRS